MDIDERVAIEVMGWHEKDGGWLTKNGEFRYLSEPIDDVGWGPISSRLWQPSKRIEQAWMVVEKMKEIGFGLELNNGNFPEDGKEWYAQFETEDYMEGGQSFSDTAPMAICQAALKAKGGGAWNINLGHGIMRLRSSFTRIRTTMMRGLNSRTAP